jgi:hypothetical protein
MVVTNSLTSLKLMGSRLLVSTFDNVLLEKLKRSEVNSPRCAEKVLKNSAKDPVSRILSGCWGTCGAVAIIRWRFAWCR